MQKARKKIAKNGIHGIQGIQQGFTDESVYCRGSKDCPELRPPALNLDPYRQPTLVGIEGSARFIAELDKQFLCRFDNALVGMGDLLLF